MQFATVGANTFPKLQHASFQLLSKDFEIFSEPRVSSTATLSQFVWHTVLKAVHCASSITLSFRHSWSMFLCIACSTQAQCQNSNDWELLGQYCTTSNHVSSQTNVYTGRTDSSVEPCGRWTAARTWFKLFGLMTMNGVNCPITDASGVIAAGASGCNSDTSFGSHLGAVTARSSFIVLAPCIQDCLSPFQANVKMQQMKVSSFVIVHETVTANHAVCAQQLHHRFGWVRSQC